MPVIIYKGTELDVHGEFVPYVPARTNCLPEDATPPEGGYFELETIYHHDDDVTELLESCHDDINEVAYEAAMEESYD